MRGIDFVNIPTTTLSQIDSSIGGKTAINAGGVKNNVGAFWQPRKVLIDLDVLATLPRRHYINGLAEALKAGLIYDPNTGRLKLAEGYIFDNGGNLVLLDNVNNPGAGMIYRDGKLVPAE